MIFPNELSKFVYYRTYSRWNEEKGEREEWEETICRLNLFLQDHVPYSLKGDLLEAMIQVERMNVLPSMRLLWSAGEAARSNNVATYNCSYQAMREVRNFSDLMYVLMSGTGAGVSVERKYVSELPVVLHNLRENNYFTHHYYTVEDSKEGWADSIRHLIVNMFAGIDVLFDYSKIRKEGERLKTMGGRASGPLPLINIHNFIQVIFSKARGRKLKPIEVSDICNAMGAAVKVGGVRRSAIIVLFDFDDMEMMHSKNGEFWREHSYRALSNISVAYRPSMTKEQFVFHWEVLRNSGTGEPGFFCSSTGLGTNPCGEILLKDRQFCNLSEVVCRRGDSYSEISERVKYATFLGTIQSSFVDFPHLDKEWEENCKEDRLLGVSLTGIQDINRVPEVGDLRLQSRANNRHYARKIGISSSTAITCIKPSGTASLLVNSSSGIHQRFSSYYIRRVRISKNDPLVGVLIENGMELKEDQDGTKVVEFYVESPKKEIKEHTAIEQVRNAIWFNKHWCDHNTSVTVYVKPHEWDELGAFLLNHLSDLNGMSFLPKNDHIYPLAPLEAITEEQYKAHKQVEIDYSCLSHYEKTDMTEGGGTPSCDGGKCEFLHQ